MPTCRLHGTDIGDFFASSYQEGEDVVLLVRSVIEQEWTELRLTEVQMRVVFAALADVLVPGHGFPRPAQIPGAEEGPSVGPQDDSGGVVPRQ
jgi:hypothetical protein